MNRSKFTAQEASGGELKLKPYTVGNASISVDSEILEEDVVQGVTQVFGGDIQGPTLQIARAYMGQRL